MAKLTKNIGRSASPRPLPTTSGANTPTNTGAKLTTRKQPSKRPHHQWPRRGR